MADNQEQHLKKEVLNNVPEPVLVLLDSVYGCPLKNLNKFPAPMPEDEAGKCANGQRRYLWTDAFGVLAYVSLSELLEKNNLTTQANKYKEAANKLVDVVHDSLGRPRSEKEGDQMQNDSNSPTGYVGLRIGKLNHKKVTDYGMSFDGQYWHYVDKWLLALARVGRAKEGILIAKSCFPAFFDPGKDGYGGIRWKLSVDSTAPPSLQRAHASDDTLTALIVFSILESARGHDDTLPSLAEEIKLLKNSLRGYKPRVTDDPLGWGLEAMFDQFIEGHPRKGKLTSLSSCALNPLHLSLPFRLYGAMIGAKVAGEGVLASSDLVEKLVAMSVKHEQNEIATGEEEHSSINRVMLAMCMLCPGALGRREGDPLLSL